MIYGCTQLLQDGETVQSCHLDRLSEQPVRSYDLRAGIHVIEGWQHPRKPGSWFLESLVTISKMSLSP